LFSSAAGKSVAMKTGTMDLSESSRLDGVLAEAWRAYRRMFKRCREAPSSESIHQLRVLTRRLQALLDLVGATLAGVPTERFTALLKPSFKAAGRIRDVQLMRSQVSADSARYPGTKGFARELDRRKRRCRRKFARELRNTPLAELKAMVCDVRERLRKAEANPRWGRRVETSIRKSVDGAFASTVSALRAMDPADPESIHRVRITFKNFRYRCEAITSLNALPAEGGEDRLRAQQKRMGEIQDSRTMLVALDKFMRREPEEADRLRGFRDAVQRRHDRHVKAYLRRADELFGLWKPTRAKRSGRSGS
jgi:CHAD domain-containing protein